SSIGAHIPHMAGYVGHAQQLFIFGHHTYHAYAHRHYSTKAFAVIPWLANTSSDCPSACVSSMRICFRLKNSSSSWKVVLNIILRSSRVFILEETSCSALITFSW